MFYNFDYVRRKRMDGVWLRMRKEIRVDGRI